MEYLNPPLAPGTHVALCSDITWETNPPTSGAHYPVWAAFRTYGTPVPRGFFMHSMEHGAVVILHNCPDGCDDELGAIQAEIDARPVDPLCVPPVRNRIIVTPDPLLPTRFAAVAWGWGVTMDCLDVEALRGFIDARYAAGPENFCSDGTDVTADGGVCP